MSDIIFNWLRGFPGLELLQRQQVEALPGGSGLYYRGCKVLSSSRDLVGNLRCRKLQRFRICRYGQGLENALFFTMLSAWVETNAPALGFDQTASLENAHCVRDDGALALWEADLELTYWEAL